MLPFKVVLVMRREDDAKPTRGRAILSLAKSREWEWGFSTFLSGCRTWSSQLRMLSDEQKREREMPAQIAYYVVVPLKHQYLSEGMYGILYDMDRHEQCSTTHLLYSSAVPTRPTWVSSPVLAYRLRPLKIWTCCTTWH